MRHALFALVLAITTFSECHVVGCGGTSDLHAYAADGGESDD